MIKAKRISEKASVLVFTLWALSLLGLFAVYLGYGVMQKIRLAGRIEEREKTRSSAESGVYKAVAVLRDDLVENDYAYSPGGKERRHNNPAEFQDIPLVQGSCDVRYQLPASGTQSQDRKRFGFVDEERKINLNTVDIVHLENLITIVLGWDAERTQDLARALIDWRTPFDEEQEGFYSDSYYDNLQFSYELKGSGYEQPEEILLVKGMDREIYGALCDHLTVYGDGAVNINTASPKVLFSLEIPEVLVNKIVTVRRGPDRLEATGDDIIFTDVPSLVRQLSGLAGLDAEEQEILKQRIRQGKIKFNSRFFRITSLVEDRDDGSPAGIACVYDAAYGRFVYWREKI